VFTLPPQVIIASLFPLSPCIIEYRRTVKDTLKAIQETEKYFMLATTKRMPLGAQKT